MHGNREDIPVKMQDDNSYIREIEWGDMDGSFSAFPAGTNTAPLFKELPHGCECSHWGYLFKGKLRVKYADHEEIIHAGEAYYMPPGHIVVMEEDCEMVEFSPKDENQKMMEIAFRNLAAM